MENFRSFENQGPIRLDSLNVFIGPNNTGKSSILKALAQIQEGSPVGNDVRIGNGNKAKIKIDVEDANGVWNRKIPAGKLHIELSDGGHVAMFIQGPEGGRLRLNQLPAREPGHFVVPYLSKRKTSGYAEDVRADSGTTVRPDFMNLAAKLARLTNPGYPAQRRYFETCEEILGFVVTAVPAENGQLPGVVLESGEPLYIDQMGDGVPNIVALLADLALSRGKLFLIEEPENDLHPHALKALLDLVIESSSHNQMAVSTHSNIVARHLGATPQCNLFYVSAEARAMPPRATIEPIERTAAARLRALRELGYSFSDFDLWDGWLFLEESSAERIIRDYLIPWFAPKLSRVRTLAAGGNSKVEPTFDDFHRLVRFTHLEDAYRDSAWVLVDEDAEGEEIVKRLRERYASWEPDRFQSLPQPQFELFYPEHFSDRTRQTLAIEAKQERRVAKKDLLTDVLAWLDADDQRGRKSLAESAAPVIELLKTIEAKLMAREAPVSA